MDVDYCIPFSLLYTLFYIYLQTDRHTYAGVYRKGLMIIYLDMSHCFSRSLHVYSWYIKISKAFLILANKGNLLWKKGQADQTSGLALSPFPSSCICTKGADNNAGLQWP